MRATPTLKGVAMATIVASEPRRIVGGVDTHKDLHVAAVIDAVGRSLASQSFPTTRHGYRCLLSWLRSHGELVAVGVEGTGSWGAGLARYLTTRGVAVMEVNRPNRQNRRLRGKSDAVDAEAAARAVLNGQATVTPKSGTGPVEAVRQLRIARSGAMKARTAAANRHRLNRGGDRQANSALWTIVLTRMVSHPPTKAYVERRTTEGLSKTEIMRCLKRYVARELYPLLQAITTATTIEQRHANPAESHP
jgi:hypothetical protein